eukprot:COSAG02_NODE_7727_length_2873_cov_6.172275_3_plen_163_part_00
MAGWRTRDALHIFPNPFGAFDRQEQICRSRHTTEGGTEFGLTLPQHSVDETDTRHPPRLAIALAGTINETLGRVVQSGCPSVFYFANACPWLVAQGWCESSCRLCSVLEYSHRVQLRTHTTRLDRTCWRMIATAGLRTGRARRWTCLPTGSSSCLANLQVGL